jgi:transcription termination/antitermination protein NusG
MPWYALTVRPQHEKAVVEQLQCSRLESYLPLYRSRRVWSDRVKVLELPLFSRYVFCRFGFDDRLAVLRLTGVVSIVSFGGKPCPVDEGQLEAIRAIVGGGLPYSPMPGIRVGQRVRISRGSLRDVEGIFVQEKNGYRVVVNVDLLNQAVAIEVERDMIEPCVPPLKRTAS